MMARIWQKHRYEFLMFGVFLLAYVPTLLWMWDRWFEKDTYYSHGILIPFVSAWLIWEKRWEWDDLVPTRSPWGMRLIGLGFLVHLFSSLFRVYFSSGFSMLLVAVGLILYFYGARILRTIAFPVFFLIFMIPLPLDLILKISFSLKLFAATISTQILNHMGFFAVQQGSIIKMQHAFMIVDDVCSGLRSLISLLALGSIFAYWMKPPFARRLLVFLSSVPIAIITNVFRIVLLSSISEIWGPQYAVGFLHDLSGFLVFALAFVLLFAVKKVLE